MSNYQFPDYLAFGKLNTQNIRTENEFEKADYKLFGEKVMEVSVSDKRAEIQEVFQNERLASSSYPNLQMCISYHFITCPVSESKIMQYLIRKVCNLGNVYFEFPDKDRNKFATVFFPAVSLQVIRIPVTDDNRNAVFSLFEDEKLLKLIYDFYSTTLIVQYKNQTESTTEKIRILEMITPVAFIYDRVQMLLQRNVILPKKLFRAIIQDSIKMSNASIITFIGTPDDEWSFYSIQFKKIKELRKDE